MKAFENAREFVDACEALAGGAGCKQYVAHGASFAAQCEPIAEIDTVEDSCEWMAEFGGVTAPGVAYDLHTSSYDEANRTVVFFGTYHAKRTGTGGPVPPTQKETNTHYVYVLRMNADAKVERHGQGMGMECTLGPEGAGLGIGWLNHTAWLRS